MGTAEDPLATLTLLEEGKRELYGDMYNSIDVDTYGLAMDAWGNIGPNLLKLIEKCDEFRGVAWADHLPSWSTWRCKNFKRAWQTRFIVKIQIAAASKLNFVAAALSRSRARGVVLDDEFS